jgi:GrpB-like predicted nucleotidyltransferase (UPF0157 family)
LLGLKRGIVRLVPHHPGWGAAFAEYAAAIRKRTGLAGARVQHVGSTSVPGLMSKPILDIVIGADEDAPADQIAAELVALGYTDRGAHEGSNGRLLVMESAPNFRTVHVHVVRYRSHDWFDYVAFRDALLNEPDLRERYALLKMRLAERFEGDRKLYTSGKESFIQTVLAAARADVPECRDG